MIKSIVYMENVNLYGIAFFFIFIYLFIFFFFFKMICNMELGS